MTRSSILVAPLFVVLMLAVKPAALAQGEAPPPAFSAEQLEQMVAPIALYPDSLVTQVLMASTYPLEIVEAARWAGKNASLKGDSLDAALKEQDWDPSIKALCAFPDLLKRLNENLDWTTDLGDAFLDQQADVMDAVQRMRGEAYASGQLKSSKEQTVTQQADKIIIIESADPEIIYVPTYSPTVVYGAPPAPYYPAVYAPPGYGALAFTAGVVWGAARWGNANWGWGGGDVDIDINTQNNFNRNTSTNREARSGGGQQKWNHDPQHRSGANYRSSGTAQKYGAQGGQNRVSQSQARGQSQAGASQRSGGGAQASAGAGGRTAGASPSASRSGASAGGSRPSSGTSSSAFSGSRSGGSSAGAASSRGASSRGSSGGGGASRGGGGGGSRGGGGGGGRR